MFSGSCWTFLQRDGYFSVIYESFIANIAFFWGHNFQYREYRSFRFTLSTLISIVMINETDICRWYRGVLNYSKSFLFRLFIKEQQPPPLPAANERNHPPAWCPSHSRRPSLKTGKVSTVSIRTHGENVLN